MAAGTRFKGLCAAFFIIVLFAGPSFAVEPGEFYLTGAIGYSAAGGSADAAENRTIGWNFYGAAKRTLPHRLTAGLAAEYGSMGLDAVSYFDSFETIEPNADDHLVEGMRGDMSYFGLVGEVTWDFPLEGSPIPYLVGGVGYYSWTVDPIRLIRYDILNEVYPDVPAETMIAEETAAGLRLGVGARFPMGDSRGIWGELALHIVKASGGTLVVRPLRIGISFP